MAHSPDIQLIDAKKLIKSPGQLKNTVKRCSASGSGIKITNTILFFDDDHPEYAVIFDELVSACDRSNVEIAVDGIEEMDLLKVNIINEITSRSSGGTIKELP